MHGREHVARVGITGVDGELGQQWRLCEGVVFSSTLLRSARHLLQWRRPRVILWSLLCVG